MLSITDSFVFNYFGSDIIYGRGCVDQLEGYLRSHGLENAVIICGQNVGANENVIGPLTRGLGDRFAGVFDGTTPQKRVETVYEGIERMHDLKADVLIGVGGGSSLDIARFMSVIDADNRSLSDYRDATLAGDLEFPDSRIKPTTYTPVIAIPTTFAGADISDGGSVEILSVTESPTPFPVQLSGTRMPIAMVYDPRLFVSTPMDALTGSAMNGFNKGLETLYVPEPNPISDSTAIHGLRLLQEAYPKLSTGDSQAMDRAVIGTILVQFKRQTSIIHAFGHGFSRRYPVQQGVIHAIMVPHLLRYVFNRVDGQRNLLATGLKIDPIPLSADQVADSIIDRVVAVRDSLNIPTQLRELEPVDPADFPEIVEFITRDSAMERAPPGLQATEDELEAVLHDAW